MYIIAELALCNCPGLLMVALESCNSISNHKRVAVPVVVYSPVVNAGEEIVADAALSLLLTILEMVPTSES